MYETIVNIIKINCNNLDTLRLFSKMKMKNIYIYNSYLCILQNYFIIFDNDFI